MPYKNSSYHRKWWVKTIRERNYFGFRYWWFNWCLWIAAVTALCYFLYTEETNEEFSCIKPKKLSHLILNVNDALDGCCSCQSSMDSLHQQQPPPNNPEQVPNPPVNEPPNEAPENAIPCNGNIDWSGAARPDFKQWDLGPEPGNINICYNTKEAEDQIIFKYDGNTIHDSGMIGTRGEKCFTFNYPALPNKPRHLDVYVNPGSIPTTEWNYSIDCPK
jgi:hypothetical protein